MAEWPFRVELAPAAQRQLRRLPPGACALEPRPIGATKLVGSSFWRIRVGDLRVIYAIEERARLVIVLRVARRAESTYRRVR